MNSSDITLSKSQKDVLVVLDACGGLVYHPYRSSILDLLSLESQGLIDLDLVNRFARITPKGSLALRCSQRYSNSKTDPFG